MYSVYAPKMISESATGMSNGGRVSSASDATTKTRKPTSCHGRTMFHMLRCDSTMPTSDSVPACITMAAAASTSGSSYAISCAAARSAPISENLFAEDQPAISTPITDTDDIAITKKMPTSRLSANNVGLNGSTTRMMM